MGLGAVIVVGAELGEVPSLELARDQEALPGTTWPCVELLGRSVLERTIERFVRAGVETISVLVPVEFADRIPAFSTAFENVTIQSVAHANAAVIQKLSDFCGDGIEHSFVVSASLYTETDLLDLFYFHREARQSATRANNSEGPLNLWVVDCSKARHADLEYLLTQPKAAAATYYIRDYVQRIIHPRDVRKLVTDALRGRCGMRPPGTEQRPGIWVDEGAEIHRRARIVAPAYIGPASKIQEDTLITRCSNIERDCYVDYGTVIENSSILPRTHVGIWLDVCHAIAEGNRLLSLSRNVTLAISDRSIMRSIGSAREEARNNSLNFYETQEVMTDLARQEQVKIQSRTPVAWQFGTNSIQG